MKLQDLHILFENKEDLLKKYNITKHITNCTGLDEEKGIWYGWSHRAIFGFKVGDKIFDEKFGDDTTKFSEHGSETIKNLKDAEKAAEAFAQSVS